MVLKAPMWDAGFPLSPLHGAEAQLATLRRVVRHCPHKRVAVDVGAHIGTWTRGLAVEFRTVYAFEPESQNFACLQANVTDKNVVLEQIALGAQNSTGALTLPVNANSGMWRVAEGGIGVFIRPLDAYCLEHVDFIKVDCEGFEGAALLGALKTLRQWHPAVWFEDNGLGQKYYGVQWTDPKQVLAELGYKCFTRIRKDELWVHPGEQICLTY